ncbi:uncharacterized protein [Miscanthus floridulus]|uniref:uncharacterized protein n=1 Tax=Miscanthus floridulus TaxID=154761 RepID=UPI00345AE9AB
MSHGDRPPPFFEGDDFPYWKVCMEAYLEAVDVGVLKAATDGFANIRYDDDPFGDDTHHEKWNAKAKNIIFRGICKDVFNRVRNAKDEHELWTNICALHEGTNSEREERYHLVISKMNAFTILPNENANEMYSHLNILVEELNGLGLTQMQPLDVVRKILCVLPIGKYGHIITVLHQGDLSNATPTQILGKINAHEMYLHINPKEESTSSNKKKDLAFKASHDKGKNKIELESTSEDEDDTNIALIVRKTTKMLKKLNKSGVKFDSRKKKFFTSSKRKPISEMDCYNCGDLGHLSHQCTKPKKDKYKKKYKNGKDER